MKKLFLLLLCLPSLLSAKVTLPSIFSDGMILQQNASVKIWGKADSKKLVKVTPSWGSESFQATPDADGNWSLQLPTKQADFKPYTLTINHGSESVAIKDVLFGEVWLCSGQSNMEMKMRGWYGSPINGGREAIATSKNDHIRLFTVNKECAYVPQDNCKGEWQKSNPKNISMFSATAYFFGRQLYRTLNVPVALVASHWGGAAIAAFMSSESLQSYSNYAETIQNLKGKRLGNMTPTAIYNAMIHPLIGYGIRGVIWYQGETDKTIPDLYRKLFKSMLNDWRSKWGVGEFPFIYAQIAPFDYPNWDGNSAYQREGQMLCQRENNAAYMVSLTDLGEEFNIHPSEKEEVGLRMAFKALDKVYQVEGIVSDEPVFQKLEIKGNQAFVYFENAERGLTTCGHELKAFTIAGADKVFYPAQVKVAPYLKNKVLVYSDKVPNPVAVRFAFTDFAQAYLYNIEGCCASSFRTDNWKDEECVFKE